MIIDRQPLSADRFTQVPNRLIRDKDLSPKARLLWIWMASHRVGWQTSIKQLADALGLGVKATRPAVQELLSSGWLARSETPEQRETGTFIGYRYTLCEPSYPQAEPSYPKGQHGADETAGQNRRAISAMTAEMGETVFDPPKKTNSKNTRGVTYSGEVTSARENFSPYCPDHPTGTIRRCHACGIAREQAAEAARVELEVQRAAAAAQRAECTLCDEAGWLLGGDGLPADPATKCGHGPQLRVVSGG